MTGMYLMYEECEECARRGWVEPDCDECDGVGYVDDYLAEPEVPEEESE